MKPAPARTPDSAELEKLGRATLEIVHDLKNQLNGLKLYATFLRKRLERMGFAQSEEFARVQFQKLEEQMFGLPLYKQDWFIRYRQRQHRHI